MSRRIYLDYNSTTPLEPRVAEAMAKANEIFGNPSSIHADGREARALIDEARSAIGRLLNCNHRQIVFTSGGTESNNLAILGAARAASDKGRHIVTTAIEHSAVLNPCHQLEREGFHVTYVMPTSEGRIEVDKVKDAIQKDTILISVMLANNEIGTLQQVKEIVVLAHGAGVAVHCDAVQAVGKVPVDVQELGVDLLSLSAHKIYGPKGAGALYWAPSVELQPVLRGGSHEGGLRAGTENVSGIHGFGVAAQLLYEEGLPDLMSLRIHLEEGLAKSSMRVLCKDAPRLPNTVNFYSEAWLGEAMVMAYDLDGISVSNGSACSSGIIEPSHVIRALGYNNQVARSVIRVSLGKYTTAGEVEEFLHVTNRLERISSGVTL